MAGVVAKVGVIQLVPRIVELAAVATSHAHGEEVDDACAVEVAVLKQYLSLDEQHEFAQEFARQGDITHPFQVGSDVISVEVLALIEERYIDIGKEFVPTSTDVVACKSTAQWEAVHVVDVARQEFHALQLVGKEQGATFQE